jgi:hypothetical protein
VYYIDTKNNTKEDNKMKYYIDDKLVRTSTRTYTHAVLEGGTHQAISCCGSYELAHKEMTRRANGFESNIRYWKRVMEALEAGKTYIIMKANGKSWKDSLKGYDREYCIEMIDFYETKLAGLHIRELEVR